MVAAVFAALLAGVVSGWLFRERELAGVRSTLGQAECAATEARTQLSCERESFDRERAGIEQKMLAQFQNVAQKALGQASTSFLEVATAKIGNPVQSEFQRFEQAVTALQQSSSHDLGALKASLTQVAQLQGQLQEAVRTTNDATGQLRTALQNPHIVGNWGEITLERIVELAGMTEHCDFDRQIGVHSLDGTGERPDLLVHLTGGLHIPIDAKASVTNYINAVGASSEAERARLMDLSCRDLKARVTELRGRGYDRIEGYAGMTFLFVPNESMLSAALSREPHVIEDAARSHIVICSPLLLLCYLQAFANGWRIQKQQDNAQEVARRGKMLHDRLQSFFIVLGKVEKSLHHTVDKFNDAVGKTDNLLVPGRELGRLLGVSGEFLQVESIDTSVREMRFAGSDEVQPLPALDPEQMCQTAGVGAA